MDVLVKINWQKSFKNVDEILISSIRLLSFQNWEVKIHFFVFVHSLQIQTVITSKILSNEGFFPLAHVFL